MSRQTFLPYAAGLALAVTLTGCAAESAAPEPMTPVRTTPVPTVSAPSSSVATSAPAAPDFPEGLPAAAKKHTKDGAKAFVQHYMDRLNVAWTTPDPDAIRQLCDVSVSKSCAANLQDAEDYKRKGWKYSGKAARTLRVDTLGLESGGTHRVLWTGIQLRNDIIDAKGTVRESYPREDLRLVFDLRWTASGWLILDERLGS